MEKISSPPDTGEVVVLLHEDGQPSGTALKSEVHDTSTPLHLAFSCYLLDPQGRVLVTRRALTKRTWPGVWTNSFCGHPAPGESLTDALSRRAREELGAEVEEPRLALPDFRYRAVDTTGIVENEICPVWILEADPEARPNLEEVAALQWVTALEMDAIIDNAPFLISPWAVLQWKGLCEAGLIDRGSLTPMPDPTSAR